MRLLACILLMTALPVTAASERSASDLDTRRVALRKLLNEHWQYSLSIAPEFASILGDKRWNDQVSDLSRGAVNAQLAKSRRFLRRFKEIDASGFSDQERLNKDLMVDQLENEVAISRFRTWEMPVNQMGGIHLQTPQLVSIFPFDTVKDYNDYIARMRKFPASIDQTIRHMRSGINRRLMPPRFLLDKVVAQSEGIASQTPESSSFALPLSKFPASFSDAEKSRIRTRYLAALSESVLPAYRRFTTFLKNEYAPKGRVDVGVWSLPDGAAYYAHRVRESTTTDLSPDEIHKIGLAEVARIEGEMLEIAKKQGFADLKAFNVAVEANPKLRAQSRQQILDLYRKYIDQMWAELPKLFGRLPKATLEVMSVQEFREKEAAGASYEQGTPDGSRPGHVMVNTGDASSRKIISMESTAYHEGVPGHHMQIAIAQELKDLPPFRGQIGHTAFIEGWALYSERLGKEVGFYQDPYSDYGRLQDEMLRAIRLVVDTGLHAKRWTREQVVQFFHDHSGLDEVEIQAETDRYIVWPGQALGYKIGQLKILELRERARRELGTSFDIREFHDEVLGAGSLPLDMLEARVNAWIARSR
ncbi:MAG TPA: DUF885 family protein [Thermoanaerobaculia bacterium]|nr:DUF885 family protein [Thermoanaerobaculia bacterium]